jgi:hypothetical protein
VPTGSWAIEVRGIDALPFVSPEEYAAACPRVWMLQLTEPVGVEPSLAVTVTVATGDDPYVTEDGATETVVVVEIGEMMLNEMVVAELGA